MRMMDGVGGSRVLRRLRRWLVGAATVLVASGVAVVVVASPASAAVSKWLMVSPGSSHTCGIKVDTTLWCWGDNRWGQLGIGRWGSAESTPQEVGGTGWSVVSTGSDFTCGIRDGYRYCWGNNDNGQLGIGNTTDHYSPVRRSGENNNWATVTTGSRHACGLRTSGLAQCWGDNSFGQVGDRTTTDRFSPTTVYTVLPTGWRSLSAGYNFTCALTANGGRRACWGSNYRGALGLDIGPGDVLEPTSVPGEGEWLSIDATGNSACGIRLIAFIRTLECWGQLVDSRKPVSVGGAGWASISVGLRHACGIKLSAIVTGERLRYCWGENMFGQVGDGTETDRPSPVFVDDGPWDTIEAGIQHNCGTSPSKRLYCWGSNQARQLGVGTPFPYRSLEPVLVSG